jgi:hypothetical protein
LDSAQRTGECNILIAFYYFQKTQGELAEYSNLIAEWIYLFPHWLATSRTIINSAIAMELVYLR